jgi:arylsulfatase A-like enzyme
MVVHHLGDGFAKQPDPELAGELRTAYTDGLRWVDGVIARAVARLEAMGLLENTLLVVTGDHGESFGEHGFLGHGRQLYDEMLRVPLVMRGPAPFRGGRVASGSVSVMDVLPTFLDWIGAPPVPGTSGVSMLPVLAGASAGRPVPAEEDLSFENMQRPADAAMVSVRTTRWKFVHTRDRATGEATEELYDLALDPAERTNLAAPGAALPPLPDDVVAAIRGARERAAGSWAP